jgi:SNF2 family DNA or RNA helicase
MAELLTQQLSAIDKLRRFKVGALFMRPGTGKSLSAIELVRAVEDVDYILWLAPYRSVNPPVEGSGIKSEVAKWGGFNCTTDFYGIESISASDRIYLEIHNKLSKARNPFIIVDESLKIKNWEAKRTKRIIELGKLCQYKLILNGTPVSRNILDVWAQMEFLSPNILTMDMAEFKNTFCEWTKITKRFGNYRTYTKEFINKYHNIDHLYSLIHHYVFEADLELTIHQQHIDVSYEIDEDILEEYKRLKEKYLDNEKLQFLNNNIFLEMTQKMQHLYCCTSEKFEAAKRLFKSIPQEETIIFCKYIASRKECEKAFPKATVLSLQKESLSLNLQHCNNLIFWDKTWDWALIDQAMHRIWRTGQNKDCRFYHFHGDVGLEKLIRENNDKKEDMLKYFKTKTVEELKQLL